jgi:ribosomal protein L11 methyltransferase
VGVYPALDLTFPPARSDLIDLVAAALDEHAPSAIHETGTDEAPCWRVFFGSGAARDEAQRSLAAAFAVRGLGLEPIDVPDEDWAARSQAGLQAVRVGRILVAPPWDLPDRLEPGDALVVIQPSMGFGTGHHETTRLCLELLQEIDGQGVTVVDVGTGSGVLALAAAALGAATVEGIDTDPDAIANALENLASNPAIASRATIRFRVEDLRPAADKAGDGRREAGATGRKTAPMTRAGDNGADIVLANLTGALLVSASRHLVARARPGGSLVVSGFQEHEVAGVIAAFADAGAHLERHRVAGDWHAAVCTRRR